MLLSRTSVSFAPAMNRTVTICIKANPSTPSSVCLKMCVAVKFTAHRRANNVYSVVTCRLLGLRASGFTQTSRFRRMYESQFVATSVPTPQFVDSPLIPIGGRPLLLRKLSSSIFYSLSLTSHSDKTVTFHIEGTSTPTLPVGNTDGNVTKRKWFDIVVFRGIYRRTQDGALGSKVFQSMWISPSLCWTRPSRAQPWTVFPRYRSTQA